MARLDLVQQQQDPALVTKLSQAEKIIGRRGRDPALALDRFDQDRRGLRRDGRAHRVEIVERNLAKTGHHRFETLFNFLLPRRRDPREGPAMERTVGRNNFVTLFAVAKFARQLEQPFVRFRTAVAKETTARPDQPNECFRELGLRLGEIKIGDVEELSRLLEQRVGDLRIGVAQGANRDATAEIEIAPARHIPDVTSLAVIERQIEARVGRDDISLKQLPDVAQPVDLDGFHVAG